MNMRIHQQAAGIAQTQNFIEQLKSSLDEASAGGQVITGAEAQALVDQAAPLPPGYLKDLQAAVQHSLTTEDPWQCDAEARATFANFLGVPADQLPPAVAVPAGQQASAVQAAQIPAADLGQYAPTLSPEAQQMLAAQGVALPATAYDGRQAGVLNLLNQQRTVPTHSAAGGHPLPADAYQSPQELNTNLDGMYGAGAAQRFARAEMAVMQAQIGLLAALQGAGPEQVAAMLGGGPQAEALARDICQVARLLQQTPLNLAALQQALMQADARVIDYAAPQPGPERQVLEKIFRDQYNVQAGSAGGGSQVPYSGGGAFGNQVGGTGAAEPPPGAYAAGSPSEAGAKALAAAQSQVGVREASGNNDGLPSRRYAGGRREPWCADFVSWCFRQTGMPLPGNQRSLASVQHMENQMKKAGKFIPSGAAPPKPGDIIFFKNRGRSDRGGGRHVGIVEKVVNGKVYTIEGNSGNRVARRSYAVGNGRISGYGRQ